MSFLSGVGDLIRQYSSNGAAPANAMGSVMPASAAGVNSADVAALTEHAQNHDASIVDRVSAVYPEHPTLIKSLGVAALAIAMKNMADQHAT